MVSTKSDMPEPRKRVASITAQIQAERDRILPNPSDRVRLTEGTYLALRLAKRPEDARTDETVQFAEMAYRGALREELKKVSAASSDPVVSSTITRFFDQIERIVMNDQLTMPRTHRHQRNNDMGPGHH